MTVKMRQCIACGNAVEYKELVVKEMMFGTNDQFTYIECTICGCLQLKEIPKEISKYYPDNYYSFKEQKSLFVKTFFVTLRDRHYVGTKNLIGSLLNKRFPAPLYLKVFKFINAQFDWKILDVGSGAGEKLLALRNIGFKRIMGIDPNIEKGISYKNGLQIKKMSLTEVDDKYDLILFNHSLEHMENPVSVLKEAKRKMNDEALIVLRIPVAGCYAMEKYGVFWDGLDAPRHLFIPTKKSLRFLADRCGLEIISEFCDSTSMQFWASEQYQIGISLMDPRSFSINPKNSIFTRNQIKNFTIEAERLNAEGKGDIICLVLKEKLT